MALAERVERLDARVTREDKELFQEAADVKGLTLTAFVTSSVRDAAIRTLKEQHVIELGRKDQQTFAEAMLNPELPNENLRRLARGPQFGRKR